MISIKTINPTEIDTKLNFSNILLLVIIIFLSSCLMVCFLQIYYNFLSKNIFLFGYLNSTVPCLASSNVQNSLQLAIHSRTPSKTSLSSFHTARSSNFSSFSSPLSSFTDRSKLLLTRSRRSEIQPSEEYSEAGPSQPQVGLRREEVRKLFETTPIQYLRSYEPVIKGPYLPIVGKLLTFYKMENKSLINKMLDKEISFEETLKTMQLATEAHVSLEVSNMQQASIIKRLTEGSSEEQRINTNLDWRSRSSVYQVTTPLTETVKKSLQEKLESVGVGEVSLSVPENKFGIDAVGVLPGGFFSTAFKISQWALTKILTDNASPSYILTLCEKEIQDTKLGLLTEDLVSMDFTCFENGAEIKKEWLKYVADFRIYLEKKERNQILKDNITLNSPDFPIFPENVIAPISPKQKLKQLKPKESLVTSKNVRGISDPVGVGVPVPVPVTAAALSKETRSVSDPVTIKEYKIINNLAEKVKNLGNNFFGKFKNCFGQFSELKDVPAQASSNSLLVGQVPLPGVIKPKEKDKTAKTASPRAVAESLNRSETLNYDYEEQWEVGEDEPASTASYRSEGFLRREDPIYMVGVTMENIPPIPPPFF